MTQPACELRVDDALLMPQRGASVPERVWSPLAAAVPDRHVDGLTGRGEQPALERFEEVEEPRRELQPAGPVRFGLLTQDEDAAAPHVKLAALQQGCFPHPGGGLFHEHEAQPVFERRAVQHREDLVGIGRGELGTFHFWELNATISRRVRLNARVVEDLAQLPDVRDHGARGEPFGQFPYPFADRVRCDRFGAPGAEPVVDRPDATLQARQCGVVDAPAAFQPGGVNDRERHINVAQCELEFAFGVAAVSQPESDSFGAPVGFLPGVEGAGVLDREVFAAAAVADVVAGASSGGAAADVDAAQGRESKTGTAPVPEGRSAATRGEDLSRFPLAADLWGRRFALGLRTIDCLHIGLPQPGTVLGAKWFGLPTHLKPPARGTVTSQDYALSEVKSSV